MFIEYKFLSFFGNNLKKGLETELNKFLTFKCFLNH